ncbi:MAG: hypothetical protein M1315_03195 [Candidatus Thermoplasmatota archaeon]|nr:hypothetical protein [Candidatus Thermoplasmatota archaeon]
MVVTSEQEYLNKTPYNNSRMIKPPKRFGSFAGAVVTGVILTPFIALAPAYAMVFVGLIVGVVARGLYRSVMACIFSGLIVTAIVIVFDVVNSSSFIISLYNDSLSIPVISDIFTKLYHLTAFSTTTFIEIVVTYAVALPLLGGVVGGLIRPGF